MLNKGKSMKIDKDHNQIDAQTKAQILSIVERVERLEAEKKAIADDIKEIFSEARAHGFDVKILKKVIKLRSISKEQRAEEEIILDLYMKAVQLEMTYE